MEMDHIGQGIRHKSATILALFPFFLTKVRGKERKNYRTVGNTVPNGRQSVRKP